jgi:hypothetical protein
MIDRHAAAELARLESAAAVVAQNLIDLDNNAARHDLDQRTLTGRTASEWARAKDALTRLWESYAQLTKAITEARALRDRAGPEFAHQVLGASITLSTSVVPLTQRGLLGAGQVTQTCTPGELLSEMESSFARVADVVARAGDVWQRLLSRSAETAASLENVRSLVRRSGSRTPQLDEADRRLKYFTATMSSDPLGVDEAELTAIRALIERADAERTSAGELRDTLSRRLADAHKLLDEIEAAERAAHFTAAHAASRISAGAAPIAEGPDLRPDLMAVDALAAAGHWALISPRLAEWTRRAQERQAVLDEVAVRNDGLLSARNELRGLFESYQAKAERRGLDSSPELAAAAGRVRELLYTAPVDLAAARVAVTAYQDALREAAS